MTGKSPTTDHLTSRPPVLQRSALSFPGSPQCPQWLPEITAENVYLNDLIGSLKSWQETNGPQCPQCPPEIMAENKWTSMSSMAPMAENIYLNVLNCSLKSGQKTNGPQCPQWLPEIRAKNAWTSMSSMATQHLGRKDTWASKGWPQQEFTPPPPPPPNNNKKAHTATR